MLLFIRNDGPLITIDMHDLIRWRNIRNTPECWCILSFCWSIVNNRLNAFKLANKNLYKQANDAKLIECSVASLAITFNLSRNDKLFPNRNVITNAWGIRIFNPYRPPPIRPESIAVTSSHNKDEVDPSPSPPPAFLSWGWGCLLCYHSLFQFFCILGVREHSRATALVVDKK